MHSTADFSFNIFDYQMNNNNGDPQGYQFSMISNVMALNQNATIPKTQAPSNQFNIPEQTSQPQQQQLHKSQILPPQHFLSQDQQSLIPQYQLQSQMNTYIPISSNENYSTNATQSSNNSYDFMNSNQFPLQTHLLPQGQIQQNTSPLSTGDQSLNSSTRHSFSHFQNYQDVSSHRESVSSNSNYDLANSFQHQSRLATENFYHDEIPNNHNDAPIQVKIEKEDTSFTKSNGKTRTNYNFSNSEEFKKTLLNDVNETINEGLALEDLAKKYNLTKSANKKDGDSFTLASAQEMDKYRNIFCVRCLFEIATENSGIKKEYDGINQLSDPERNTTINGQENGKSKSSVDCVQRSHIYAAYHLVSDSVNVEPFGPSIVGKLIRIAFPNIKTKRLGTRGKSKYHYTGIMIKDKYMKILANTEDKDIEKLIRVSTVSPRSTSLVNGNGYGRKNSVDLRDSHFGSPASDTDRSSPNYNYHSISKLSVEDPNPSSYENSMPDAMFKQCILSGEPSLAIDQLISYTSMASQSMEDQLCELDFKLYYSTLTSLIPIAYKKMNQGFVTMLKQTATDYPVLLKERFSLISDSASAGYFDRKVKAGVLFTRIMKKIIKAQESCFGVGRILDDLNIKEQMITDLKNLDIDYLIDMDSDLNEYDDLIKEVFTDDVPHFFNYTLFNPTNEEFDLLNDKVVEAKTYTYSESILLDDYLDRNVSESQMSTMKSAAQFFGSTLFSKFGNVNLKLFELLMNGKVTTCVLKSFNAANPSSSSFSYWWHIKLWVDEWVSINCEMLFLKLKLKQAQEN